VGRAVVAELKARGLPVRGFDRVPTPGLEDSVVGDITDGQALLHAAQGTNVVVHLAATPDDDDFMTQLLPNNIVGVYRVLEAARLAGVKRMILASSGQVNWGQRATGPWPVRVEDPVTPRYWYAATKMFLEAAGRAYAEAHGISVIVARLGWCPRTVEHVQELKSLEWGPDVYLSPSDAGRFFACAVQAPAEVRFAIVFAASKPVRTLLYDRDTTRRLLGYEPRDTWPEGIEVVSGS
jgi:nucleoside-diphosphate-sugar epimerase